MRTTRLLAAVATGALLVGGLSACAQEAEVCGIEGITLDITDTRATIESLERLREEVPSDLRADIDGVLEPLRGVDLSEPSTLADISISDLTSVAGNVRDWSQANC